MQIKYGNKIHPTVFFEFEGVAYWEFLLLSRKGNKEFCGIWEKERETWTPEKQLVGIEP